MFFLLITLMIGWCDAGPFGWLKSNFNGSNLNRAGLHVSGTYFKPQEFEIGDDLEIPVEGVANDRTITVVNKNPPLTSIAIYPNLPSVPLPFPTFGPLFTTPAGISFPPESSFPTGIVGSSISLPPSAVTGVTTCDCLPVKLCVNHSSLNVISTRIITKPPVGTICPPEQVYCCVETTKLGCGIPNIIPGVTPALGQAHLGQYPWSVIILGLDNSYVGGGVLIDSNHVLTVAHRVAPLGKNPYLKVRLGEWDISKETEPVGYLDIIVAKLIIHPNYEEATLQNDIAVISLADPVSTLTKPNPQINSICLPDMTMSFTGVRCKVAGWGKDEFNGNYQNIIKEVEVPVLSGADCQTKLRNTRLGSSFTLDTNSFICAGGEAGKDACTGDGGNALACMKDGKFFVAGLTAGGIECGKQNVPGLYVNLVNYIPWINAVLKGKDNEGIDPRRNRH